VQDWSRRASQTTTCSEDFHALVSEAGLTHLYLKTGVGSLQPAALANCSDLLLIYQRNGISLYEITRPLRHTACRAIIKPPPINHPWSRDEHHSIGHQAQWSNCSV
jgi:hypothetical protein